MAIVYRHRRLDNFSIFYIGIGKKKERAYSKIGRNKIWQRITNKHNYKVEIIADGIGYDEAKELEVFLIKEYGRKDKKKGSLCNLTDGGDGCYNRIITVETRKKISNFNKGRKATEETKLKMKLSNKHLWLGKTFTKEHKEKLRNSKLGIKKTKEHIESLKKPKSEIGTINIAKGNKGKNLGSKRSLETKELLGLKKRKKVIDTQTKIIFNSLTEAAISINMSKGNLGKKLNGKIKNETNFKYIN